MGSDKLKQEETEEEKYHSRKNKLQKALFHKNLQYTLRPQQEEALEWFKKKMDEGKKYFLLEMPTGVGKSIWSQYAINHYIQNVNPKAKVDILTNTKILQQQYINEFSHLNNLWGKTNYFCEKWQNNCEYGKTCNKNHKTSCEECPYNKALNRWSQGAINITNFHIHSVFSLFNLMPSKESDFLIVDEAHALEETVNDFVTFTLSKKNWKNIFSGKQLEDIENDLLNFQTTEDIARWLENKFLGIVNKGISDFDKKVAKEKNNKDIKTLNNLKNLQMKLNKFLDEYKSCDYEWVSQRNYEKGEIVWKVQPLWTNDILKNQVWTNYDHVVMMTATIIDPQMFCRVNGIDPSEACFLRMDTPFEKKNRKIYYYPQGKLSYKNKNQTWKNIVPVVKKILEKYKGKKGIIHTGNYEIWHWLKKDLNDPRLIFASPDDREKSLEEHKNQREDSVLVSPSMMHGIDLKDDHSRFQIIIKVPYPSLADEVNKKRAQTDNDWYSWRTVVDIVQGYGRSIRDENDYAETFILDSCFSDLLTQYQDKFPKHFKEALKKVK